MSQAKSADTTLPAAAVPTGGGSSRRALLTAAPAVAARALLAGIAVNVAASNMARADGLDWPAIIVRAEQMIEKLRDYYGPNEWSTADEEAANRMLKYCCDHGPEDDEAGWDATFDFFEHYNCSFDWVYRGDPVTMVVEMAAASPRGAAEWDTSRS
jgi:hypothetical protein